MKASFTQDIEVLLSNLSLLHQYRLLSSEKQEIPTHPLSSALEAWQQQSEKLMKPSPKDYALISHFLLIQLNQKKHEDQFKHCFVPQSMAENREFKKVLKSALQEYSEDEPLLFPSEIFKMKSGYETSNPAQALRLLRVLSDALMFKILEQNHHSIPLLPLTRKEVKDQAISFVLNDPAEENVDPPLVARAKRVYRAQIECEVQKFRMQSWLKLREQESWKECARKLREEYLGLRKQKKKLNVTRQTQLKSLQSEDGSSSASNMEIASLERIPLIEQTQSMKGKLITLYQETLKKQHFHVLKRAIQTQNMTVLSKQNLETHEAKGQCSLEGIVSGFNQKLKTSKIEGFEVIEAIRKKIGTIKKKQQHGLEELKKIRAELV